MQLMRTHSATCIKNAILIVATLCALFWAQTAYALAESRLLELHPSRIQELTLEHPATGIAAELPSTGTIEISIQEHSEWSPWITLLIDNDATPWGRHSQLIFTDAAQAIRLRSTTRAQLTLHIIAASDDPVSWEEASTRRLSPAAVVIPRWQWGADESLRTSKRGAREMERIFNDRDPFLADRIRNCSRRAFLYPDEFREVNRKFTSDTDQPLAWPQGYSRSVHLIAIHHTAESSPSALRRSGEDRMRTIYEYHTKSRGWGDIGYNYVIDPDGSVYEGRAGGDYVVGAHAYCNNVGTVGIALMGNFQSGRPTDAQLIALNWLSVFLADKYNIDPAGHVIHHGKLTPTIVGHRDLGQTACPGHYSHELLPQIRLAAKERDVARPLFSSVAAPSTQNEAALMASLEPITIPMGELREQRVQFMNVGLDAWNNKTWLLGEGDPGLYFTEFKPFSFVAGFMEEDYVPPGEIGTFRIAMQGGLSEKNGNVRLIPVINNDRRLINNPANLPFAVRASDSRFTHVVSYFPHLHKTGEDLTGTVKLINAGNVPWEKDTITEVVFDIQDGTGEVSVLNHPKSIGPGEQGSFQVRLQNVEEEGHYARTLVPRFAEGSVLIGSAVKVAAVAEPIPDIALSSPHSSALSYGAQRGGDPLSPLPSSARSRGRETGTDVLIEALAGTNLTLKPREQAIIPLRIRAGKHGMQRGQTLDRIVRSHPLILLLDEESRLRMRSTFRSPVSLRKFQTHDMNLIVKAPRTEGTHTFSIGDMHFTISTLPSARATIRKDSPRTLSRRLISMETIRDRRRERRSRRTRTAPPPPVSTGTASNPPIRIRLFHRNESSIVKSPSAVRIEGGGTIIMVNNGPVHITREWDQCRVSTADGSLMGNVVRLSPTAGSYSQIISTDRRTNRFRGVLECRVINDHITFINELSLEEYLAGLAEEPDSQPFEKQRAFAIAARSYALFYLTSGQQKFPGLPYNGSDDPREFQAYGGVEFEEKNPRWAEAVRDTAGRVLSWERKVVKAPYFSRDNGRTKSAQEVWGWTHTPYLDAKDDPWCKGLSNWGHGVGMSGCGAKGQAEEGRSAEEILEYYYPGTRLLPIGKLQ